ncbi:MAG: TolC family protein [Sphingomonas sp.]|jgi:cobalt-zinc-cadmium efflux system outer membrane protein|uniref:TolC family protein n=1 Tax=unclassified Sphingomonas TaxID=196159 RepID=UPI0008364B23|nr:MULTISPECIES: TolC family protein [unclassified Sphingomonas]MBX9860603.1 TolC family protein [Sphingomonas sp.]
MSRTLAALLAATVCVGTAAAQTTPVASTEAPLTLDDAIASARARSPGMDAADAAIRATTAGRTVAGLRPNPTFEGQAENVVGTGPYKGLSGSETTVGFSLPIETGGKRSARVAVADTRVGRAKLGAFVALADLELQVAETYVEALGAERRLLVAQQQAAIATEGLRVARDRVTVGAASPIDQQRADVISINANVAVERAERSLDVARQNLSRLIGSAVNGPLDTAWFDRVAGFGPTIAPSSDGTLALAIAAADLATAEAQIRLARANRVPDITLSAGARRLQASRDTAAVVGVSIPIPLFNNGRAAIGQATAERDQLMAQLRLARLDADRAIASAVADVANAAATARAANGPALAAAQEAARIARLGYGQGKFNQIELLDAERTLSETRATATDALIAFHTATARLRRLTSAAPSATPSGDYR